MKKLITLIVAFLLTGCAAVAPVPPTAAPTQTPAVVIATVLVTVVPTQEPTQVPTDTPVPPPTTAPTAAPTNTSAPAPAPTQSSGGQQQAGPATATLPANAGGDLFTSLTRSSDHFALRCLPMDITFSVSTANAAVTEVDLYYRMEDRLTVPISLSSWKNGGKMTSDGNGNFTIDFQAVTVSPDLRTTKGWFDYQFVGINKYGDAVGRSLIIPQQISYTIECP